MGGFEISDVVNSVHIKLTNLFCLTSYKYSDKPEIYFVRILLCHLRFEEHYLI